MTPNEYQQLAQRTIPQIYEEKFYSKLTRADCDIIHAHMGISSEAGEVGDAIKKYYVYNQPFDIDNLLEECGDLLWYVSLMVTACNSTLEQVMEMNITKLQTRYPEKFTEQDAKERKDKK